MNKKKSKSNENLHDIWSRLPAEIWSIIFSMLHWKELVSMRLLSKNFNSWIEKDDLIWKKNFCKEIGDNIVLLSSWYQTFLEVKKKDLENRVKFGGHIIRAIRSDRYRFIWAEKEDFKDIDPYSNAKEKVPAPKNPEIRILDAILVKNIKHAQPLSDSDDNKIPYWDDLRSWRETNLEILELWISTKIYFLGCLNNSTAEYLQEMHDDSDRFKELNQQYEKDCKDLMAMVRNFSHSPQKYFSGLHTLEEKYQDDLSRDCVFAVVDKTKVLLIFFNFSRFYG